MTSCYPKAFRLLKSFQFESLAKHAHTFHGKVLFIVWRKNLHGVARLGITANRKQGSSVLRNRFKRLVREAFRTQKAKTHLGIDIHVRPNSRSKKEAVGNANSAVLGVRGKKEFPPSFEAVIEDITAFFHFVDR